MVELGGERAGALKEIAALSSEIPVFDAAFLKTIQWAATHYVAPLSVLLERSTPPQPPHQSGTGEGARPCQPPGWCPSVARGHPRDSRRPPRPATAVIGPGRPSDWLDTVLPVLGGREVRADRRGDRGGGANGGDGARDLGFDATVAAGEVARDLTKAWTDGQGRAG